MLYLCYTGITPACFQTHKSKFKTKRKTLFNGRWRRVNYLNFSDREEKMVLAYRYQGKQNQKTLGEYPGIVEDARQLARDFKQQLSGKKLMSQQ
jgi:hypothetical protein